MSLIKKINDPNGKQYDDVSIGALVLDTEPIEGSFNPVTSDAVVKAIDKAKDDMQEKIDEVTLDPSAVALGNVHLLDEETEFPADGCILVDSETNGPGEMSKDTLLTLTAQNALGSIKSLDTTKYKGFMALDDADGTGKMDVDTIFNNFAPEFVPSDKPNPTTTIAGLPYMYNGSLYMAKEAYQGPWDASKFIQIDLNKYIKSRSVDGIIPFDIMYHFYISSGVVVDNANWNAMVIPYSQLGNRIKLDNTEPSDLIYGYFVNGETFTNGSNVGVVQSFEIQHGNSIDIEVPKCKNLVIYIYKNYDYDKIKIFTYSIDPRNFHDLTCEDVAPSEVKNGYAIGLSSGKIVFNSTNVDVTSAVYDVSKYDHLYVSADASFRSNAIIVALTDENDNFIETALQGTYDSVSGRYITHARNHLVWCNKAVKMYIMFTNVGENQIGLNVVTTGPIDFAARKLKTLESEFHNGELFYNGAFSDNWRCCADVYNVSGEKHLLMDYCYDAQIYHCVFLDSEDNEIRFFASSETRFHNRKLMLPVPPDAVKLIITSTLTRTSDGKPVPYYRTKVYSISSDMDKADKSFENALYDERKSFDIFFIGNSLTQDAVSYVPFLLKNEFPDIDFNIYMWYMPGYTLKQQWEDRIDPQVDVGCSILSAAHSDVKWANGQFIKMSSFLAYATFDHLCLQEYFNFVESYTAADCVYFNNIVSYIVGILNKPIEVECLFHAPKRGADFESIYQMTKNGNILLLQNTPATDIFIPGCAIYEACKTSLDSLGDESHLSPDGTHAQEGLPCLLEAYTIMGRILEKIGKPLTIEGVNSVVDSGNYDDINVPGANLGTGVVEGTEEEYKIAKQVASSCMNKRYAILAETF